MQLYREELVTALVTLVKYHLQYNLLVLYDAKYRRLYRPSSMGAAGDEVRSLLGRSPRARGYSLLMVAADARHSLLKDGAPLIHTNAGRRQGQGQKEAQAGAPGVQYQVSWHICQCSFAKCKCGSNSTRHLGSHTLFKWPRPATLLPQSVAGHGGAAGTRRAAAVAAALRTRPLPIRANPKLPRRW